MKRDRFGPIGFVVLALAALLNVGVLYTANRSFVELRESAAWARRTQLAQNLIERVYRLAVDAETGQRGYLLTGDGVHLAPYTAARGQIEGTLKELAELTRDNPVQIAQIATVGTQLQVRFDVIDQTIALKRDGDDDALRDFMRTSRTGKVAMDSARLALDGMAAEEQRQSERRLVVLAEVQDRLQRGFFVVAGINLLLITMGVIFLSQDLRRRRREAVDAREHNAQLAQAVQERTGELMELSHHLQRVQEDEKAKIAREIHDELGGTLAAAKIDLQLLSNKLRSDDPQQPRIARIMGAIDEAVTVKRRIIEDLRPTMIDSLGIGAALKWQCSQYSARTGSPCRVDLHDDNLRLSPNYSIAFYRVVQEGLTNVTKYANAKSVAVALRRDGDHWVLRIADDGVGIDVTRRHNSTAHGLLSMRERVRALGGEFSIRGQPGQGTVIDVRVPVEREPPG